MASVENALLRVLAGQGDHRFAYIHTEVTRELGRTVTEAEVSEAAWLLASRGLVFLDRGGQNALENTRWRLTGRGQRVAAGATDYEPDDPERFMTSVRSRVWPLDELVELYLTEALVAFEGGAPLASSVMLGVASERLFDLLAPRFVDWLPEGMRKKAGDEVMAPARTYLARFKEFRKRIEPMRSVLPSEFTSNITLNLDAVADLLRVNRNEAGHPTGRRVTREEAYVNLQVFARYLAIVHELMSFFEQNPSRSEA